MNKQKLISICAVVALSAVAVVGGTLAYFTDKDVEENVFTVGNVSIDINEYTADKDGKWNAFDEQQKLFPIAHDKTTFNKLAETENDGSEPAYIRTFVTCPKDMYDYLGLGFNTPGKTLTNANGEKMYSVTWKDLGETFTINGEETAVFLCEYKGIVQPGESVLSLTKVWLYENVTNEIVKDFNLTEGAFKVEVASQAIQAENLTYDEAMAELGTINQTLMDKLFA